MRAGAVNSNVFPPSGADRGRGVFAASVQFRQLHQQQTESAQRPEQRGAKGTRLKRKDRSRTVGNLNGKVACRPIGDTRCAELVAPKRPLGQVIARHCGIPRAAAVDYDAQVLAHIVTFSSLLGQEQETIHELVDG